MLVEMWVSDLRIDLTWVDLHPAPMRRWHEVLTYHHSKANAWSVDVRRYDDILLLGEPVA